MGTARAAAHKMLCRPPLPGGRASSGSPCCNRAARRRSPTRRTATSRSH